MQKIKYKCSQFNYIQEKEKYVLIYNTLYNSFVRLNQEEYDEYKTVDEKSKLASEFIANGLWIEKDIDEFVHYLACSKAYTLTMTRPLDITVTTTLKCNARCAYCYEKGVRQNDITENAQEKIVHFILDNVGDSGVHLVWFGGEPLMNPSCMDYISTRLQEEHIYFSSYIITNGSLLTDEIISSKFKLWNVQNLQITLDGTKGMYEARKQYIHPEEGEFYKILNTIRAVSKENVFINVRLNIERSNKMDMMALLQELDSIFASYDNVVFYPAFVTGTNDPMTENEKVQTVKEMLLAVKNIKKLTANTKLYSLPRMHACMNGDPRSFSIDVNGNIYACEHYVGKAEYAIGNVIQNELQEDHRGRKDTLRDDCKKCVFLPKCYGGCEANYLEGDDPCMIEKYLIKAYLEIL